MAAFLSRVRLNFPARLTVFFRNHDAFDTREENLSNDMLRRDTGGFNLFYCTYMGGLRVGAEGGLLLGVVAQRAVRPPGCSMPSFVGDSTHLIGPLGGAVDMGGTKLGPPLH